MKNKRWLSKIGSFFLLLSFTLWQSLNPDFSETDLEVPPEPLEGMENLLLEEGNRSEYMPNEFIVKLNEGHSLMELDDLRQEYRIFSVEDVFQEVPSLEEGLKQLKKERAALENPDHSGWYWWNDKESKESKEYEARIAQEKEDLDQAIAAKEALIDRLSARQKRA